MPDRRRAIDHVHLDEVLMPWATAAAIVGNRSCDSATVSPPLFTIRQLQERFAGVLNAVTCTVGCRLPAPAAARASGLGDLDLRLRLLRRARGRCPGSSPPWPPDSAAVA